MKGTNARIDLGLERIDKLMLGLRKDSLGFRIERARNRRFARLGRRKLGQKNFARVKERGTRA